jgi:hypothetical protein
MSNLIPLSPASFPRLVSRPTVDVEALCSKVGRVGTGEEDESGSAFDWLSGTTDGGYVV